MIKNVLIAACVALAGVSVWLWASKARADALVASLVSDVARLERNEVVLKDQLKRNARAMLINAEYIAAQEQRTAELTATIEQIKEIPDALLDPALADIINGLHGAED